MELLSQMAVPQSGGTTDIGSIASFWGVIGALTGVLIWYLRHTVSVTIPTLEAAHRTQVDHLVANFREESKLQREQCQEEAKIWRDSEQKNREALWSAINVMEKGRGKT